MVDEVLAKSFLNAGKDYDRFRPGFPVAAADLVVPHPVHIALDLGAGTGKFTERLVGRATRLIAIEPSEQMLAVLKAKLADVEAHIGTAESIPVDDGSVDVVTVAQAFHWFDRSPACAEIRRVLVPGGTLGLLWNRADPACSWDRACSRIAHPWLSDEMPVSNAAQDLLTGFTEPVHREIAWHERITRADYLSRWLTVSTFLAASVTERSRMVDALEHILDTDTETAGRREFDLPQITDVYVYRVSA